MKKNLKLRCIVAVLLAFILVLPIINISAAVPGGVYNSTTGYNDEPGNTTDGSLELNETVTFVNKVGIPDFAEYPLLGFQSYFPDYYTFGGVDSVKVYVLDASGNKIYLNAGSEYLIDYYSLGTKHPINYQGENIEAAALSICFYNLNPYLPPSIFTNPWAGRTFTGGKSALENYEYVYVSYEMKLNENAVMNEPMRHLSEFYSVYKPTGGTYNHTHKVWNYSYLGGLTVFKTNEEDKPLSGAEFKLYKTEQDAIDNKNAVDSVKTDSDGVGAFKNLTFGEKKTTLGSASRDYWIAETAAPSGYKLDSTPIKVTVNSKTYTEDTSKMPQVVNEKTTDDDNETDDKDTDDKEQVPPIDNTETPEPDDTTTTESTSTGDSSNTYLYVFLVIASAGAMGLLYRKQKHSR